MENRKQVSPYQSFKYWLLDGNLNSELKEDIIKAVNPRAVLCMFGNNGNLTEFLNDNFNKFEIFKYSSLDFYKMVKEILYYRKFRFDEFTYFSLKKEKDTTKEFRIKFPFLKDYEIKYLLDHNLLDEYLELNQEKKKKITKKELKDFEKCIRIEPVIKESLFLEEEKPKKVKPKKEKNKVETWDDLKKLFNFKQELN